MEWKEAVQASTDKSATDAQARALVGAENPLLPSEFRLYCVVVAGAIVASGCDATGVAYHLWRHGLAQADWRPS